MKSNLGLSGVYFTALLTFLFILLWLIDFPAVFGRCPGENGPNIQFYSFDPTGFTFGLISALTTFLSPCGLPALPAYIRYFLGARASKERSISLAFLATSGFVFAIAVAGILFVVLRGTFVYFTESIPVPVNGKGLDFSNFLYIARPPSPHVPNYTFITIEYLAGALAIGMGIFMILKIRIPFFKSWSLRSLNRSTLSVFLFSMGWAGASVACAPYAIFPLFFYVVVNGSIYPFVGYALGMAVPVLVVSLLLSFGKGPLVQKLVASSSKLHRLSGFLLVGMGVYVVLYTYYVPSPLYVYK